MCQGWDWLEQMSTSKIQYYERVSKNALLELYEVEIVAFLFDVHYVV